MMWINLIGLALIVAIVWWFWLSGEQVARTGDNRSMEVLVGDGVYTPSRIEIPAQAPVTLTFVRRDASPCAATVIFDGIDVSRELPVDKPVKVPLPALAPGRYVFHCQMNMYKGEIIVRA